MYINTRLFSLFFGAIIMPAQRRTTASVPRRSNRTRRPSARVAVINGDTAPEPRLAQTNVDAVMDGASTVPQSTVDILAARVTADVMVQLQPLLSELRTLTAASSGFPVPGSTASNPAVPVPGPAQGANLQQALTAGFMGELHNISSYVPLSLPLGATVPLKLKQKIWANEYIELGSLLRGAKHKYSINLAQKEEEAEVFITSSQSKPVTHIDQWSEAFAIFSAIFCQQFPEQSGDIIKYSRYIVALHKRHHGSVWRVYDEEFRKL